MTAIFKKSILGAFVLTSLFSLNSFSQVIEGKTGREINIEKNYIKDGDAEVYKTGFSVYKDAGQVLPEDGTGGSPTVTFAASASTPLEGAKSFVFTKDGANRQGEGFSYNFTIDSSLKGKVVGLTFDYVPSANYADDDMQFWVYYIDGASSKLVPLTPYKIKKHTLDSESMYMEFQAEGAAASTKTYRLIGHVASTSASAYTVKFDNFKLGKMKKQYGAVTTDWVSYSPTTDLTSNVTNLNGRWRRAGDSVEVQASFELSGTPASGSATISLPSGMAIDTSKLPAGSQTVNEGNSGLFGSGIWEDSGVGYKSLGVAYSTTSKVSIHDTDSGSSSSLSSAKLASGDAIGVSFKVPIVGWSSSQIINSDSSQRVVAMSVTTTGSFTAAQNSGTFQQITGILAPTVDTHGGFSSNSYTIKVPGIYKFGVRVNTGGNAGVKSVRIYLNGVSIFDVGQTAAVAWSQCMGDILYPAKAGDVVTWYYTNYTTAETWYPAYVSVELKTGPSQIAASESVSARYATAAGQSIPNAVETVVDFGGAGQRSWDSHLIVSGTGANWKATAPISGEYEVAAKVLFTSGGGWNVGEVAQLKLTKSGADHSLIAWTVADAANSNYVNLNGTGKVKLLAGEYITLLLYQSSGAAINLEASAVHNWVEIRRVGNY